MNKRRSVSDYLTDLAIAAPDQQIPLSQISPPSYQPRRYFDPAKMELLVESVKQHGILQPLLVRPKSRGYELVAGERRYRAAVSLNLLEVPVVVRELTDQEARVLSLIENLQRENLNPVEETEGILTLLECQLGESSVTSLLYAMKNDKRRLSNNVVPQQQEVIESVFRDLSINWESFIQHRLPLLRLPEEILQVLREGRIEYTKARVIARIKDEVTRREILIQAIEQDWSLSQIRGAIAQLKPSTPAPGLQQQLDGVVQKLKKSRCWGDEKKRMQIQKLLKKMEDIIDG